MNDLLSGVFSARTLLILLPIILLQLSIMTFCILKIVKEGVANLNKITWILIVVFLNFIGPILFLIVGRKK